MATVLDVANYILDKQGPMTAMKLQKLCYYSQAWSLVWDDKSLFDDRIEAWANGPVVPCLYQEHRGRFTLGSDAIGGDKGELGPAERVTVDAVVDFYGGKSSQWLSELTHKEAPWKDAREGLPLGMRGDQQITEAAMAEYYGSL